MAKNVKAAPAANKEKAQGNNGQEDNAPVPATAQIPTTFLRKQDGQQHGS
jgi:hypothetical protein